MDLFQDVKPFVIMVMADRERYGNRNLQLKSTTTIQILLPKEQGVKLCAFPYSKDIHIDDLLNVLTMRVH